MNIESERKRERERECRKGREQVREGRGVALWQFSQSSIDRSIANRAERRNQRQRNVPSRQARTRASAPIFISVSGFAAALHTRGHVPRPRRGGSQIRAFRFFFCRGRNGTERSKSCARIFKFG